jgi:glycosyltransferase involved in cell wall biosynthesis
VGSGSEDKKLRSIANSNIEFLGYLTERELVRYYRDCRALIFPGIEDFGLTALEAQSFGKPVIAFRGGGALETIIEGKTGEFFYPQNEEALIEKVKDFRSSKYDPMDCIKNAERFSFDKFKKRFLSVMLNSFQHLGSNGIPKQVRDDTEKNI